MASLVRGRRGGRGVVEESVVLPRPPPKKTTFLSPAALILS